jgi:Septum formation
MLDAPCDGYPSRLKIRLAWWAEPEMLPPGQSVSFYGQRGGEGRVLVSSSAPGRAFTGIGRRQPDSPVQSAPPQPGGQRAGWRCLRWGPPVLASLGFVVAVGATVIVAVPYLTGHRTVDQLRAGDCLTGSNLGLGAGGTWPEWVAAVPCTDQHLAEVFFAGNAWPQSAAYPGDKAISDQGLARCATEFKRYDGIDYLDSTFTIDRVSPAGGDDWASGDRLLVCMADQTGISVNYSIKQSNRWRIF